MPLALAYLELAQKHLTEIVSLGMQTILSNLLRLIGSALSFALRLKNRNSGASHTHMPKNVAISANPGAWLCCLGYEFLALCLAFCVTLAK